MTSRFALLVSALAALLLSAPAGPACAYEAPDFGNPLFSSDGIFLAPEERVELLEALVALAANFPDHQRIDEGIREKALGLALKLEPFDLRARAAHQALLAGQSPAPLPAWETPVQVAEALWTQGQRLLEPPLDPEERQLGLLLLELSLLLSPQPPAERLVFFARRCGDQAPSWGKWRRSGDQAPPSQGRARDLFSLAKASLQSAEEAARSPQRPERPSRPSPESPGPRPAEGEQPKGPPAPPGEAEQAPRVVSLALLGAVSNAPFPAVLNPDRAEPRPRQWIPGQLRLTLRRPRPRNPNEREGLGPPSAEAPTLPLVPSERGISVEVIEMARTAEFSNWPEGRIGELHFEPSLPMPGPRSLRFALSERLARILIESALADRPLDPAYVLLGDWNPEDALIEENGDPAELIEKAAALNAPYALVPAAFLDPLVQSLQRSNRLELLFQQELLSYENAEELRSRLSTAPDEQLQAASAAFAEIEAAAARLPLPELARNPSAQERLRALLEECPEHLSARAMLEYGQRPVSEEIRLQQFAEKLHAIAEPFISLALEEDTPLERPVSEIVAEADSQLLRLRAEALPPARNLLSAAEDLVGAAKLYLQLTNRDTAIANQRRREALTAIGAYREELKRMGISVSE